MLNFSSLRHFIVSALDSFAGLTVRMKMQAIATLELFVDFLKHKAVDILLPDFGIDLAHQLLYERERCTELEREIWILKRRYSKPANNPLCFCGRLTAIYYAIRYPYPLKKLKSHIGLAGRTISRYRNLLKRGVSFLIPKRFRLRKPRTPEILTHTVWAIHEENPTWGRWRIAYFIWKLGTFISPSTVRNILLRPKPHPLGPRKAADKPEYKPFLFDDGIWAMDFTSIKLWGNKVAHIFAIIELTSRKIICMKTLFSLPDSMWVTEAIKETITQYGKPLAILTDRGGQFIGETIEKFCFDNNIKRRLARPRRPQTNGRIERFFGSLKRECLYRTFRISVNQVDKLCKAYVEYYNTARPHHALDGATPDEIFYNREWQRPAKDEKYLNGKVKKRFFCDGLLTSYYLEKVA
ncbi:transposase [Candidatus Peregrinibacteria bacterium]|nr:transposase [Candidatus Peregrinibacteria bacterium]